MNNLRRFALVCVASLLASTCVFAQSFTASVRGTVTDESNASIGSARVVITSVERGISSTANTDESGRYVVTALQPGSYTLTVEAPGFKRFASQRFTLNVQEQATVNASLCKSATYPRPSRFKVRQSWSTQRSPTSGR
jgi:hypothetical protein